MELYKLSTTLGCLVLDQLRQYGIKPRINKLGLFSFEFTQEELEKITELTVTNPTKGCLEGLEHLSNLQKLKISSKYSAYSNVNYSISDKDVKSISKVTSLRELSIANQGAITWLELDSLVNLEQLVVTKNNRLEEIVGLDKLTKLINLSIYGNKELYEIPYLKETIMSNELESLDLDLLHYPEVSDIYSRISKIAACSFVEAGSHGVISFGSSTAKLLNEKCKKIVDGVIEKASKPEEVIVLIEQYLAENITYDHAALETHDRVHMENGHKRGPRYGTQSAYNGLMIGSCVCEGYTRSMQYLLKLLKVKSKNVYCVAGKDRLKVNEHYHNKVELPDDGYHSIIKVEFKDDVYYCDPCWDSCVWHRGDKTLPYCLKNKQDISKDHTLSFEEDNISIDGPTRSMSPEEIQRILVKTQIKPVQNTFSV